MIVVHAAHSGQYTGFGASMAVHDVSLDKSTLFIEKIICEKINFFLF